MVFIILRMKLGLLEVFLGFVLMHIFLLWNLLIFTRQKKKKTAVEKGGKKMGAADQASNEIIHYLPTVFQGHTINMQTMYMSWLTMVIVILIVVAATS
jgi:isoprenylcysteine carboxyl methyltransferase (ICMT) family protein YpbQ